MTSVFAVIAFSYFYDAQLKFCNVSWPEQRVICLQSVKYNSCQCLPDSYEEQRYLLHSDDITVGGKRNAAMLKSNNCRVSLGRSVCELEETSLLFIFFLQKKKSPAQRAEICFSDWGTSSDSFPVSASNIQPNNGLKLEVRLGLFLRIKHSTLSQLQRLNIFLLICITVGSSVFIQTSQSKSSMRSNFSNQLWPVLIYELCLRSQSSVRQQQFHVYQLWILWK